MNALVPMPLRLLNAICAFLTVVAGARPQDAAGERSSASPDRLRVVVWNIQRGANHFDQGAEKARDLLRQLTPDVCLLQESYDIEGDRPKLGPWIASELGWNAWQGRSPHLCVLTPLEIKERHFHAPWHGVGARLVDRAGREFVAWSIWIDYREYTPYALRDKPDITDAELLACESEKSNRLKQARALLADLKKKGHLDLDVPLLVGGDWNCPSHLDWTEDTARVYRFRRALPLPVSRAVAETGLVDVFRTVHSDPVQFPGITWTPLSRGTADKPVPHDRIDRLYLKRRKRGGRPRLAPLSARVLPQVWEPMDVPQAKRAFPSDHGLVVLDFEWR